VLFAVDKNVAQSSPQKTYYNASVLEPVGVIPKRFQINDLQADALLIRQLRQLRPRELNRSRGPCADGSRFFNRSGITVSQTAEVSP
jgi:hypothetical protein